MSDPFAEGLARLAWRIQAHSRARANAIYWTCPQDDPAYLRATSWLWFMRPQASASVPASAASAAGLPPAT